MEQHNEIISGSRAPSRKTQVDAVAVRAIRALTKLSQPKFALILDVDVGTLRNWEQGRREPTDLRERCCAPSATTRRT